MSRPVKHWLPGIPVLALGLLLAGPAPGADRSDWAPAMHSQMRVIAAGDTGTLAGRMLAGVEIRLDEGWKTYWRYPGDSGIPPRFDWSASANIADVEILYPAPVRFEDSGGQSIGYKTEVIFPLLITPADPSQPVELDLTIDYAVCADICIPEVGTGAVDFASPARPSNALRVRSYLDSVPERLPPATGGGVVSIAIDNDVAPPVLHLDVALGEVADADLFVEPPEGWYLPMTTDAGTTNAGLRRFSVELDGMPDEAEIAGTALRVTGVTATRAFEQVVVLPDPGNE